MYFSLHTITPCVNTSSPFSASAKENENSLFISAFFLLMSPDQTVIMTQACCDQSQSC